MAKRIRADAGVSLGPAIKPPLERTGTWPYVKAGKYKPNTMLDSGAFSAWYHSDTVDLDAYIAFIREHQSMFYSIVALDQIPGDKARMAKTQRDIEAAAAQSQKNFLYMRKAGIENPIPVFHQGEDFKWLEWMLDHRIPYIGISPYMKATQKSVMQWMDECFTRLTDKDGIPLCKTHGFGVTGHQVVRRYPWFSVDSTSWALSAGYGNILMPSFTPIPDFTHPIQCSISERDQAGNNSIVHIGPYIRRHVDAYFEALGVSFSEVRNFQEARLIVNASYFMGLQSQLSNTPFQFRKDGLKPRSLKEASVPFDWSPSIFLATMIKIQQQGVVLTKLGVLNRLISYYDCRRFEKAYIDEYTANGFCERGPYAYRMGTDSYNLRRRMLFLKRLALLEKEKEE